METKTALITGVTGQDGSYMADLLLNKGYEIFGFVRRLSQPNLKNIQHLVDNDDINLIGGDLADQASIVNALNVSKPDELYHFGSQSFVGESWNQPELTVSITGLGSLRIFEAVKHSNLRDRMRILQASSSEQFGNVSGLLNEDSHMRPRSPYGSAKLLAHSLARVYRESYGMWISCSICFNHESPRRGIEFVSKKITDGVAKIYLGKEKELKLGDLNAKRDWGYSPDYIEIIWQMLQQDNPDDFVISSGENHTVKEFVELAFDHVNLNWKDYVIIDKSLLRPAEIFELIGDHTKAKKILGWRPKTSFKKLVEIMVDTDIERLKKEIKY